MAGLGSGNWGLKLLSVLMAVVLWVYVTNDQNPTKEQEFKAVPVEARGVGANLAVSEIPGNVSVRVQADQNVMAQLTPRSIQAFVDLSSVKAGKTVVPVQVKAPAGAKIIDLRPQEVTVRLEPLKEKQVPIKTRNLNEVVSGYRVFDIKTRPDEVILRGPQSALDRAEFASIDVDLKGRDKSFGATLPVKVTDDAGNFLEESLVKRNPSVVEVLVSVVPETPVKTVPVYPQITGNPARGFSVSMTVVDPPNLVITGDSELVSGINRLSTQPVNINGAVGDIYTEVMPLLPAGVTANRQSLKVLVKIGGD